VAKSAAFKQVTNYREAYNLFACSGILLNYESPLRLERQQPKKCILDRITASYVHISA
jgi:GDPmannose 4,6-dehydratase